jgi:hypothetical protein
MCSIIFLVASTALAQAAPALPILPLAFTQRFNMSDGSSGQVFYDYSRKQQRIDHADNTRSRLNQCYFWY